MRPWCFVKFRKKTFERLPFVLSIKLCRNFKNITNARDVAQTRREGFVVFRQQKSDESKMWFRGRGLVNVLSDKPTNESTNQFGSPFCFSVWLNLSGLKSKIHLHRGHNFLKIFPRTFWAANLTTIRPPRT